MTLRALSPQFGDIAQSPCVVDTGTMHSLLACEGYVPRLSTFASLLVFLGLVCFWSAAAAGPPVLTDSTVSPLILQVGGGVQTIDVSVQVSDPDGDLKPESVKVVATFNDGTKEKHVLDRKSVV